MAALCRLLLATALALSCLAPSSAQTSTEVDPGWPGSAGTGWELLSSNVGLFVAVNSSYTVRFGERDWQAAWSRPPSAPRLPLLRSRLPTGVR